MMTGKVSKEVLQASAMVTEPLTMADLIESIRNDPDLKATRRNNGASSIRRFCALLSVEPSTMPAAFWAFREHLSRCNPAACGVSKKRFATIKSDVAFALRRISAPSAEPRVPHTNAWIELKSRADNIGRRWILSRLASYCSALDIAPAEVDDAVIGEYRNHVERQTFKTSPQRHIREISKSWNQLAAADRDLGLSNVTLPDGRKTYTVAWDELSQTFRSEADDWLKSLSEDADLFDERAPTRPLKPASIQAYKFKVRQLVGALREQGHDVADLQHLEDLVEQDRVRSVVAFFQERSSHPGKIADGGIMHVLRLIARWTRPDDESLHRSLKRAKGRLSTGPKTMGGRARAALRQFDDPDNVDRLLQLPPMITAQLDRKTSLSKKEALDYQAALVLELLFMRPIRLKNLAGLQLNRHVFVDGNRAHISIPADEVKNDVLIEHVLPEATAAMLKNYIRKVLPILSRDASGHLFPGGIEGQPKAASNLGRQIRKFVRRETGLYVTAHLMRHFGAKIYLGAVPEGIETVRQVLSQKSAETTARSYVGLENAAAIERYDKLILARRARIDPKVRK